MRSDFRQSFARDLKVNKTDHDLLNRVKEIIEEVEKADKFSDIKNLKKLKGESTYYRIRSGKYRIGVTIKEDLVTFVRALPRKDIYRYFP